MLTYQLQERSFLLEHGGSIEFPNKVNVEFLFCPTEAFGKHSGKGRTVPQGSVAKICYNANTGRSYVQPSYLLKPLDVTIEYPDTTIRLKGNRLSIRGYCKTQNELAGMIETVYYGLPPILNVSFAEPPIIKRVTGKVGNTQFCWAHKQQKFNFDVTNQGLQETKVSSGWLLMDSLNNYPSQRRILAALQYYYVACRLYETGNCPSEFLAEIILNYCKVLEVLFPPKGDGNTRNAAREGLMKLGYSEGEIEGNFLPAMALRSEIDVGHVKLSLFNREQLNTLHEYTAAMRDFFHTMLIRLIDGLKSDNNIIEADPLGIVNKDTKKLIRKLGANLSAKAKKQVPNTK